MTAPELLLGADSFFGSCCKKSSVLGSVKIELSDSDETVRETCTALEAWSVAIKEDRWLCSVAVLTAGALTLDVVPEGTAPLEV